MHILGIILAIAAGIAIWIFRINMAARAARELGATARDAHSFWRRMKWKAQYDRHPLEGLADPRDAAAVLMLLVARAAGEVTISQKARMAQEMQRHFKDSQTQAQERMTHAAWLARDLAPESVRVRRLTGPIVENCSAKEKEELVAMLQGVATTDGALSQSQNDFIARVEECLAQPV